MKTIELNTVLTNFDGKTPLRTGGEVVTFKDALLTCLGQFRPQEGKQTIVAHAVGCKIYEHSESTIEVEDEHFKVIQAAVSQNGGNLPAVVMGPVHGLLNGKAE